MTASQPAIPSFFFSSRRRHTRYWRDWSSDVCSSDLLKGDPVVLSCVRLSPLLSKKAAAHRQVQEQLSYLDRRLRGVRGGPGLDRFPPRTRTRAPRVAPLSQGVRTSEETAPMAWRTSPLKPKVSTRPRSSELRILLVACRATALSASSGDIPEPSSRARIREMPPPSISTSTLVAPASREFSISSLTAEAGRSMTSPAAILCAASGARTRTLFP